MQFPTSDENSPFFSTYIRHLPQRDPLLLLEQTRDYAERILAQVQPEHYDYAYAPGKWTVKQLLSHIVDTEHILSYRALRFARGDNGATLPFDENEYVAATPNEGLDWDQLLTAWRHLRAYTLVQFGQYTPELAARGGSSTFPCTVQAVCAILSGHVLHHLKVLQERYLEQTPLELDEVLTAS